MNTEENEEKDTKVVVTPGNTYGYDKLTKTELRKVISDLTKSVLELRADKKTFVDAANEAIKDTDARIRSAAEALKYAEATGADDAHEQRVSDFLKAVPSA